MKNVDLIYVRHNVNGHALEIKSAPIGFHDLTILIKGKLNYVIDGENISLDSRDVIFIPKGSDRMRKASEEPADYISFNFTCDGEVRLPKRLPDAVHSTALLLIAAYDKMNTIPFVDHKEKNEHLLSCLISLLEDRANKPSFNPITLKIMEYIRENIDKKISLKDIGGLTFFSPIYCDTVFKKDTGKSIIDYLIDARIEEAKKLLIEGALSLQEISESVGFNDYNYFSRVFKARSGYSPRAYRKMMLEQGR